MDPVPYPSNLGEVEALIRALYSPGPPEKIKQIQEMLQRVQKSAEGWQLAESLLANHDGNIKFFGALTVIVKLNTESSSLSDEDSIQLVQSLVGWLVKVVEDGVGPGQLVMLKLCSALSTYFIHFSHLWKHCIRHLVQCFDLGRCIPVQDFDPALPVWMAANNLSWSKLRAVICFASTLADDANKTDPKSAKFTNLRAHLSENAKDVVDLLVIGMDSRRQGEKSIDVGEDAIRCLQSWIVYEQSQPEDGTLLRLLRPLVDQLILLVSTDELWEKAVELLTEILDSYSNFLTEDHYRKLASMFQTQHFQIRYRGLIQGDLDHDMAMFGWLMLAYGGARVTQLMEGTDDESQLLLSGLAGLTGCPGYIAAEDRIFISALEFWSNFVETMADNGGTEQEPWFDKAMMHVKQVLSNCWRKIQWPQIETIMEWDASERAHFMEARKDVADLLEAVFALAGPPLVSMFVDLVLQYLNSSSWTELEASVFYLCSLADCISDDDRCDDMISRVFSAPFFNLMLEGQGRVPLRLRHTALQLIERYSDYFERRPEFLASALNILFGGLGDSALGSDSAKYIARLCSSCRQVLTSEVPAFLGQFGTIYHHIALDSLAEEKVVLAIASVIQAVNDPSDKLSAFAQLLGFARMDIERSLQLSAHPQNLNFEDPLYRRGLDVSQPEVEASPAEISSQLALRALRCISAMAKGMQSVREGPVDLDAAVSQAPMSSDLAVLQDNILTILNQVLVAFPTNGEVVEVICNIFRAGFSETEPGPFVFPPATVSSFFTSLTINSPRIGAVVSTACSFLSSLFKGPPQHLVPTLFQLLPWVITLLQALPEPKADTELTQHSIDLIRRLMAKAPEVLFQLQPTSLVEFFFLFTLEVLNDNEPLPKAAAAEFWTEFLALKSEDPAVQALISGAAEHLGPLVSRSLVRNIGGEAMRSELDKLSEPLKRLIVQQPRAQAWLEAALLAQDFPSDKVSADEKSMFLKKIINLRGSRQTNQVVREFWLACRGSSFAYAS